MAKLGAYMANNWLTVPNRFVVNLEGILESFERPEIEYVTLPRGYLHPISKEEAVILAESRDKLSRPLVSSLDRLDSKSSTQSVVYKGKRLFIDRTALQAYYFNPSRES